MELDKQSLKILKFISKNPVNDNEALVVNKYGDNSKSSIEHLLNLGFVERVITQTGFSLDDYEAEEVLTLTSLGSAYLEQRPGRLFERFYPHIISTLALIISLIALFKN